MSRDLSTSRVNESCVQSADMLSNLQSVLDAHVYSVAEHNHYFNSLLELIHRSIQITVFLYYTSVLYTVFQKNGPRNFLL